MINQILLFFFFLIILACSNPQNQDRPLNEANNRISRAGNVTVLCRCNKGGEQNSVSWSGSDQASAEAMAKRNCESIQGSASECKVIN